MAEVADWSQAGIGYTHRSRETAYRVVLRIGRRLRLVTLVTACRAVSRVGCGLVAGWDWLHLAHAMAPSLCRVADWSQAEIGYTRSKRTD